MNRDHLMNFWDGIGWVMTWLLYDDGLLLKETCEHPGTFQAPLRRRSKKQSVECSWSKAWKKDVRRMSFPSELQRG